MRDGFAHVGALWLGVGKWRWLAIVLAWLLTGCQLSGSPMPQSTALPSHALEGTVVLESTPGIQPSGSSATMTAVVAGTPAAPISSPHVLTPLCREHDNASAWYERLFFRGRGYVRVVSIETSKMNGPSLELAGEVGRVFAPWQAGNSGDAFWYAAPGAAIHTVRGIPAEEVLAVVSGEITNYYCALEPATPLVSTSVVRGRVERVVGDPYCEFSRCDRHGEIERKEQVTIEMTVREVWQGLPLAAGQVLTVVALHPGYYDPEVNRLAPGDEVVLLVRPQEALEDFQPPEVSGAPKQNRRAIWVADLLGQYRVDGDVLHWVGNNSTAIPLSAFRAGIVETFAGVTPSKLPATPPVP